MYGGTPPEAEATILPLVLLHVVGVVLVVSVITPIGISNLFAWSFTWRSENMTEKKVNAKFNKMVFCLNIGSDVQNYP